MANARLNAASVPSEKTPTTNTVIAVPIAKRIELTDASPSCHRLRMEAMMHQVSGTRRTHSPQCRMNSTVLGGCGVWEPKMSRTTESKIFIEERVMKYPATMKNI